MNKAQAWHLPATPLSRRHHYIPKHYLRRFAYEREHHPDNARVWMRILRKGALTVPKRVADAGWERDFQMFTGDGGKSDWWNRHLSELEGVADSVARFLCADDRGLPRLDSTERQAIAALASVLRWVVPARLRRYQRRYQDPDAVHAILRGLSDDVQSTMTFEDVARESALATVLDFVFGAEAWKGLAERQWQMIKSEGARLIISDDPVCEFRFLAEGKTPAALALPLDPLNALVMYPWEGEDLPSRTASAVEVRAIREASLVSAERFAFGHAREDLAGDAAVMIPPLPASFRFRAGINPITAAIDGVFPKAEGQG